MIKLAMVMVLMGMLSTSALAVSKKSESLPEVWMLHFQPKQLVEPNAEWSYVKGRLNGLGMAINSVIWLSPEELKLLVSTLKKNNIKLEIECGLFDWDNKGPRDWTVLNEKIVQDVVREKFNYRVGEETARIEMGKLQKLFDAGGSPDYLFLDDSVRRMMCPGQDVGRTDVKGFDTVDASINELIDYMREWRKKHPNIKFYALANFPNWGWKGDTAYWGSGMFNGNYFDVLSQIIRKTKEAGIPIQGVTADYPYEYFAKTNPHIPWLNLPNEAKAVGEADPVKVDWKRRLADLEKYVRSEGLEFNLIVNTQQGGVSAEYFSRDTLKYLDEYRKSGGGADRYIIESWYKHPEKYVPETEEYTLTWLVKEVMKKIKHRRTF